MSTALAPTFDARQALVDRDKAVANAAQALDLLMDAQRISGMRECPILRNRNRELAMERYRQQADTTAWRRLMDASGLYPLMDERARRQWRKELDEGQAPPLTADTIDATFSELYERRGAMLEQAVEDVFRMVSWGKDAPRPLSPSFRVRRFLAVSSTCSSLDSDLGGLKRLASLLAVMDGRNDAEQVAADFHDACWKAMDTRQARCPYFRVEWFKSGSAKVFLERMDLADKLNAVMAKRWPGLFPAIEGVGVNAKSRRRKAAKSKSTPGGEGQVAFGP